MHTKEKTYVMNLIKIDTSRKSELNNVFYVGKIGAEENFLSFPDDKGVKNGRDYIMCFSKITFCRRKLSKLYNFTCENCIFVKQA